MIGDTVALTVNAVGKTLSKINQDSYGAEYYLRETDREYRMKIRHSKQAPTATGKPVDRHNVELTCTILATSTTPSIVRTAYFVLVNEHDDVYLDNRYIAKALADWQSTANLDKVYIWES
ncbi:MAG: putative coat protein [Shiltuvirus faecivicinum]|uniref:Coat protein n=1 Tax=Leviviridae sp. TaxID=2027243 RepID=A0ABY3SUJ7_9VIRU|nr:MAG: putative coat protein [Leviviridae sp.]